ncbi:hypothetical protein [Paractinoplanes durhamensis]|uniref:Uncharacterized protein n=1 Tax=Paractinoplanes durhamensis TaxID=113563 RepID=A0ABQ3YVE9_9ACTN|nr:hypothetical protein [Actinoplanes durhamensis]GIE01538.1 hypothetical protein Adu01nite_28880 [Actinoplanes durhamensis]
MTAPQVHQLPPAVTAGLRGKLRLAVVSAALLAVLFAAGAAAGLLIAPHVAGLGILLAAAYLTGLLLALGVWSAARRGRRAVGPEGIGLADGRRARSVAHRYTRLSRIAAALTAVAAIVLAFTLGDVSLLFIGVLSAFPLLSLASVAHGVTHRLARNLP